MNTFNLFIPITKVDVDQRLVYGTMTAEVPDASGEIMDYKSGKPEFEKWSNDAHERSGGKSKGNVRAMHASIAAGKLIDISFDDVAKRIDGVAKIVDDDEWKKVLEGVYTGFSIGGRYAKRWKDEKNPEYWRYTPIPSEVSVVDNPCCPTATFSMVKADGTSVGEVNFKHKESAMGVFDKEEARKRIAADLQQGWLTKDNTFYPKKDEALDALVKAEEDAFNKKEFSDKKREQLAGEGKALPDGSFPIEDEKDLKNAVHAFGRAKDKDKAKSHIIARAKSLNLTNLLPSDWESSTKDKEEEKKEAVAKLQKDMCDVARTAHIIQELDWICQWVKMEENWEGDEESDAPAHLEAIVHELCDYLRARVDEEATEITEKQDLEQMVMELAAGLPKDQAVAMTKHFTGKDAFKKLLAALEKAGARHSKADNEHGMALTKALEEMGTHMAKMKKSMGDMTKLHGDMEDCHKAAGEHADAIGFGAVHEDPDKKGPTEKAAADELKKAADEAQAALKKTQDEAAAALAKAEAEKLELQKKHEDELKKLSTAFDARIKKLEDQPLPAKGAVFAVKKAHGETEPDKSPVESGPVESVMRGLSPADARRLVVKRQK